MRLDQLFPMSQELEIKFPTGEATGIKFKLVGTDSKEFEACALAWAQRFIDEEETKASLESIRRREIELLSA